MTKHAAPRTESNHLYHLLEYWLGVRDTAHWVLGSVIRVQGSAYRRPGAHMLFNDTGEIFGILSGGCLEADLSRKARLAVQENNAVTLCYDSSDEGDRFHAMNMGCGGIVDILLQPITEEAGYLLLPQLFELLRSGKQAQYQQSIHWDEGQLGHPQTRCTVTTSLSEQNRIESRVRWDADAHCSGTETQWVVNSRLYRPPHLAIFGGGQDARPVARLAITLGWLVTVIDPRPANAQAQHFPHCHCRSHSSSDPDWLESIDATVVMNHSIELDAASLKLITNTRAEYCGLLGPTHRTQRVFDATDITVEQLPCELSNPAGLPLGGGLPESIALSMIGECHRVLYSGQ